MGLDISDWWSQTVNEDGHLKLSSRRLLTILKHLPDDSLFKNACREDWSEDKYIRVGLLNEVRLLRHDQAVIAGADPQEPILVRSPSQLEMDEIEDEHRAAIRGGIMLQLHATIE